MVSHSVAETVFVLLLCAILYLQYLQSINNPHGSTIFFFLFVLSNFMIMYINTRYRDHVESWHTVAWWKWLALLLLFAYLLTCCTEASSRKRMVKSVYILILIFLFNY